MPPCTLRREDCLVGTHLAERLRLTDSGSDSPPSAKMADPFWRGDSSDTTETLLGSSEEEAESSSGSSAGPPLRELSLFERVVTSHPPVLESLLSQIPTRSIFNLHQSSRYLRSFLEEYPLAWKALSFRLPQPTVFPGSPGIETPDSRERQSKQYALDALLISVVMPLATRLKSLDLCNTAVSGVALVSKVLQPRISTLEHLSVRGCKNVSIKYHIVPFLQLHSPHQHPWVEKLALKSLYTYRCRHHRRRPYLPSSLLRRDSDSEPTHELIEICHQLGIWTDTAWCPTPGARCFRRKDYHGNRAAPGTLEVWVPFDRLWRSGNRIGPTDEDRKQQNSQRVDGRLWEDNEMGHDGEALGTEGGPFAGDGKYLPAHLRKSHTTFVDNIKCDQCGDAILERCETCSIKMHCMGCRKTLCGSCAFNRPIPRKRTKVRRFPNFLGNAVMTSSPLQFSHLAISTPSTPSSSQTRKSEAARGRNRFWWAPGASRSPNIMSELPPGDDSDDVDDTATMAHNNMPPPPSSIPLKLDMHWCCLEPIFSGGGGVAFLGPGISGSGSDRIRAVPLPKQKQYEDPDFMHTLVNPEAISNLKNVKLYEEIMGENVDILPYLGQENLELQANTCPRSLCQECYRSFRWKVSCRGCKRALCKEHDFRALKVRKCGFRDLSLEREYVRNPPPEPRTRSKVFDNLKIPAFRKGLRPESGNGELDEEELPMLDQPSGEASSSATAMARETSTTSSSAESSQFLLVPPPDPTDRPSSINNFDMSGPTISDVPPRSVPFGSSSSSSRQRSISLSGLQDRASALSSLQNPSDVEAERKRLLLPCHEGHPVQWEGCGSFFCQPIRPVGDSRARCTSSMRECGECQVLVCEVAKS
jgi:hypothetical protein